MSQNDIDKKVLAQASDSVSGSTPLMFAAIENKMQVMERLINLGCDINKRNKENYTALHFGKILYERYRSHTKVLQYYWKDCTNPTNKLNVILFFEFNK